MNKLTVDRIRELLGNPHILTRADYAELVSSANADTDEGAEWLPYYKLALALLMQAFGQAMGMLHGSGRSCPDAEALARLHLLACGIGPNRTPERRAAAEDKIRREWDAQLAALKEM